MLVVKRNKRKYREGKINNVIEISQKNFYLKKNTFFECNINIFIYIMYFLYKVYHLPFRYIKREKKKKNLIAKKRHFLVNMSKILQA